MRRLNLRETRGRHLKLVCLMAVLSLLIAACAGGTDADDADSAEGTTEEADGGDGSDGSDGGDSDGGEGSGEDAEGEDGGGEDGGEGSGEDGAGEDGGGEDASDGEDSAAGGGTFRMAVPTVVSNIDPGVYEGTPSTELEIAWAGPLYEFADPEDVTDDTLGTTGLDSVQPLLVESDEEEDDGSLVITLREATSPYGNTLTSEDVAWTMQRVLANDFVGQFVLSVGRIDAENPIEVIDERTFRVNVTEPNPYVRAVLTLWNLSPLDSVEVQSHATDEDEWASEWLSSNTATYGPYNVTTFSPGESITMETNPGWPGDAPAYGEVLMQQVPDASSRLQLLQRGEVEYAAGLQPEQFASVEGSEEVDTTTRVGNTMVMLELNHAFEPFQDQQVRQAIAHAIDREAIVSGPMQGFADVLANQLPSGLEQPDPPEPYTYDPERARELLAEAGYAEGLEFPLTINLTRPGPYAEQIAVLLESQLADVGITAEIETIASNSEFEERKTEGQLTAWLGANTPIVPEAWYFMQLEHHSTEAFQNFKGYANEEFDALLGELRDLPVGDERDAAITEAHEFLMEDVPYVPIFNSQLLVATSSSVDAGSLRQYSPFGPLVREATPS
ncbi:ABC transporter substrate-binding protein [Euzebya tangerina]|uniref:ABC transporter substrate-binding protein n=1 Tax=Euzebya tangerina TaxID=591198 RepID=UPI0013C330B5|nr:ABC transporter substrate-binding protein [Euzebya tangerina]